MIVVDRYSVLRDLLSRFFNRELIWQKLQSIFAVLTKSVNTVGADGDEGPPVPFPNTVVKLVCVDNTRWATAREDREAPTSYMTQQYKLLCFHIPP